MASSHFFRRLGIFIVILQVFFSIGIPQVLAVTTIGLNVTTEGSINSTQSANDDALNITGTNITTADLIDLDATALTAGDAIDINMAATRTGGSAILINDAAVTGTVTGDLLQVNVTGTKTTNTLDVDVNGGSVASGNEIDITYSSAAHTGNAVDLNMGTNVAGDGVNIATAATTGNAIDITTSGVWTNELIDINVGAQAATGDVINVSLGATAVAAQALVVDSAGTSSTDGWVLSGDNSGNVIWTGDMINLRSGTGDASGDFLDMTFEAGATDLQGMVVSNAAISDQAGWLMDIDTSAAWTGNMIDITSGAQLVGGNYLDINVGDAAQTGDVINIAIPATAASVQTLVVTNASTGSSTGWFANIGASGIYTGDVIAYDNTGDTATGASADFIDWTSGTGDADGDIFELTAEAGATSLQMFDIDSAAVSDEAGWLMDIDTSAAWTGNMIDITSGAQTVGGNYLDINVGDAAQTGDVINIAIPATAASVQTLVVTNASTGSSTGWFANIGASGIYTGDVIAYDNTGDTATGASADFIDWTSGTGDVDGDIFELTAEAGATSLQMFDIDSAAVSDEAGWLMDIDTSAAWTGNMIDITSGAQTVGGNYLDINVGNAAQTGDVVNIDIPANAASVQTFVVTNASTGSSTGWFMDIDTSGAWTGNMIDVALGAQNSTANVMNIGMGATAVGAGSVVITASGARTDELIDVSITATEGTHAGISYSGATSLATNATTLLNLNGNTNVTGGSGVNFTGVDLQTPTVSSTAGTTYTGYNISAAGALTHNTTGTLAWRGYNATMPNITQTGSTLNASGFRAATGTITTGGTVNGVEVVLADAANGTGNGILITPPATTGGTTNAIKIGAITTSTGTDSAILIGDVWDAEIDMVGATGVINVGADGSADQLDINAELTIHLDGGAVATNAICSNQGTGDAADALNNKLSDCSGALDDYAEIWSVAPGVTYGDIVALGTKKIISTETLSSGVTRTTEIVQLVKTSSPYQDQVVGIVSDNYHDLSSIGHGSIKDADNPLPIALNGRVPVNVTNENGPILVGDFLTTSSTPGKAMKAIQAGRVIGMALGNFDGESGQLAVHVFNTFWTPSSLDQLQNTVSSGELSALKLEKLTVGKAAVFEGNITVKGRTKFMGQVTVGADTAGTVTLKASQKSAAVEFGKAYVKAMPIVTVTPLGNPGGNFWVSDVSEKGFTVNVSKAPSKDLTFNWIALGTPLSAPSELKDEEAAKPASVASKPADAPVSTQ